MTPLDIALIVVVVILAVLNFISFLLGVNHRKKYFERETGLAEVEAKKIIAAGEKAAEQAKKEALLTAKEENLKAKNELDREIKDRRAEISKIEHKIADREDLLDKKLERLEQKDEALRKKIEDVEKVEESVEAVKKDQLLKLERLSGLTSAEAKAELVQKIEDEARADAAESLLEIEARLKEESDTKAKEIITTAMQRCASDFVAEATVSVVPLPNDEVKGRIIGREGRNIRTLEQLTGVDLIIDDTPEAITLSSFDPVRREIARLSLEKLVVDGRIHPARIEDIVEKAKKEVDNAIKQAGDRAVLDTGLHGINPEIVKVLGRLRYRTSYGQNVLAHSIEVAYLSGILAGEIGADVNMAKRAGLLHDIGKATSQEHEGTHTQIGVDLAKKYKERPEIIHAIEAHHGDVEARTAIAVIVQVADALSAARPGARRENVENFIKRLQRLEEIAGEMNGVEKAYAIQAGREVRVIVKPEVIDDKAMVLVARDIARKIESELKYPGQIKVNIIRESRASEIAK